jgi:anti-repressor protein
MQLFNFKDHEIRTTSIDGETHWFAKDICAVLDIDNVTMALTRVDPLRINSTESQNSRGQMRATPTVNDFGLFDLILSSRKPDAVAFRNWVTGEVLPTLARKGVMVLADSSLSNEEIQLNFLRQLHSRDYKTIVRDHRSHGHGRKGHPRSGP